ncbi:MAG: SUMF1/EgtB/PvdO family nonheme iron enzyme [Bacteroidetes bacterium]|nr:SUMF1/EgtB/PvdO family nonheme iron enzyme [Bacteroidota bacterium]
MVKSLKLIFVANLLVLLWLPQVHANYLRITGVTPNQTAGTVTFGLQWQNSWRTNYPPFNWDAAWVFVKFRECGVDPNTEWTHGIINLGASTLPATLESTTRTGTAGIDPDNLGVMLRRTSVGKFNDASAHSITLRVTNMLPAGTDMDIKVFGIEMVFIPEGAFFVGDGVNTSTYGNFFPAQRIDTPSGQTLTSSTSSSLPNVTIPATFPNGYGAFYIMKYEISHGQYAEFLNTLPSSAENPRNVRNTGGTSFRHALMDNGTAPTKFYSNYPDRALNYLGWADLLAYLDWAALRPYTELEYEKACRGAMPPVPGEYSWGNTTIVEGLTYSNTVPAENGSETLLEPTSNCNYINNNFVGGVGASGPTRVGIFARNSLATTRTLSGATYYGVLDMTGNLWEYVVLATVNGIADFNGALGDGYINPTTGHHNVVGWPDPTVALVNYNSRSGIRGGSWGDSDLSQLSTSNRYYSRFGYNIRENSVGGRGAR